MDRQRVEQQRVDNVVWEKRIFGLMTRPGP
jgi:hypothetical protein